MPGRDSAALYRRGLQATAWVHSAGEGTGTGWVLANTRLLVTCYHVVGENATVDVYFPISHRGHLCTSPAYHRRERARLRRTGHLVRGRVIRRQRDRDLAVVALPSVPKGIVGLPLAREKPAVGTQVLLVGHRYDTNILWTATTGKIVRWRTLAAGYFHAGRRLARGAPVVVASTPIHEGDSGAALLTPQGAVIGVVAAIANQEDTAWCVDSSAIKNLVSKDVTPATILAPAARQHPLAGVPELSSPGLTDVEKSLVRVRVEGTPDSVGWLVDRQARLLLTTSKAVGRQKTVQVIFPRAHPVPDSRERPAGKGGEVTTGHVLARDPTRNLALLELRELPPGVASLPIATRPATPGTSIHLFAFRGDSSWNCIPGSVRQHARSQLTSRDGSAERSLLLLQASLSSGGERGRRTGWQGGPVFNGQGQVIAMLCGANRPRQVVIALCVGEVMGFVREHRCLWEPRHAQEWTLRGQRFLEVCHPHESLRAFTAALQQNPNLADAWGGRGWGYHQLGKPARAVADLNQALQRNPRLVQARCHRAAVLCSLGRSREALLECHRVRRQGGLTRQQEARVRTLQARAFLLQNDSGSALQASNEAIWLDRASTSGLARAYLRRGQAHALSGESKLALQDFTRALNLDSHLNEAHRRRGDLHWKLSDVASATVDYTNALREGGCQVESREKVHAHLGRAYCHLARNHLLSATRDLGQALRMLLATWLSATDTGSPQTRP